MGTDDWFRNTTWSPSVRTAFFERLNRSRGSFHKSQYARIQALHLEQVGTGEMCLAAIELLDLIQEKWWAEAQQAAIYSQYAQCYACLGELDVAVKYFHLTFEVQRRKSGELTDAHMDFGWLVITIPMPEHFDEALKLIDEFGAKTFPIQKYRAAAIKALVHIARGKKQTAKEWAEIAIEAAAATESGFHYHQKVGLVKSTDDGIYERLKGIVTSD